VAYEKIVVSKDDSFSTLSLSLPPSLQAGTINLGTDEDVFTKILVSRSRAYLLALFRNYEQRDMKIEDAVSSEMSANTKKAFLGIGWFSLSVLKPSFNVVFVRIYYTHRRHHQCHHHHQQLRSHYRLHRHHHHHHHHSL
jgi:hypothetical protein